MADLKGVESRLLHESLAASEGVDDREAESWGEKSSTLSKEVTASPSCARR